MVAINDTVAAGFPKRLDRALDYGGFPAGRERKSAVAKAFGVSREAVRKWLDGESLPQTSRIMEIAKQCGVRTEWLLSEKGSMEGRGVAEADMPAYVASEVPRPAPDNQGDVPLISWVKAGEWHEAQDPYLPGEAEMYLPCPRKHGPRTYALRVVGTSMFNPAGKPSYDEGDIIFVDPDQAGSVGNGDRVLALLPNHCERIVTFKQFVYEGGQRFLRPLNPQFPPITGEFEIVGKVIGAWRD